VVGHEVEDHCEAAAVDLFEQDVEFVEGSEDGIDVAVVCDVVAKVGHRRRVDGREPEGGDAEIDEVIEALADAREVADAVSAAVLEGAGIDLVDNSALPPG
jgi:hypothetical protein